MRFGIRDLMLATVLVTMYCVVFVFAPTSPWTGLELGLVVLQVLLIVPWIGAWWWWTQHRIGRVEAGFRAPRFWAVHFWFAGLALIAAGYLGAIGQEFPKPIIGQFLSMHGMFLFFLAGVRLGEHGVAMGPTFMPWREYRFELEDQRFVWRYVGATPKFGRLSHGKLAAPAAECEAVRRVLAARQRAEEQPPRRADEHG